MSTDAEGWSPERETSHHIGMRIVPSAVAVALVEHSIRGEADRPHLTAVSMPREVEVDAMARALLDGRRLVVENKGKALLSTARKEPAE